MCSNRSPDNDGPVTRSTFIYLDLMSIVLHVYTKLRISWYQRKNKINADLKTKTWVTNKTLTLTQNEIQSIADFTTNAIGILAISSYALLAGKINSMSVLDVNTWPNYILINLYQLILPSIVTRTISTLYYHRHPYLRKTMWRELKNSVPNIQWAYTRNK
jgi:hypothetical protein